MQRSRPGGGAGTLVNAVHGELALGLLTAATLALRCWTAPHALESQDAVYFVRGVLRTSIAELRPQWPGYPVYMLLGQFLHGFGLDPASGLRLLSILASSLSVPVLALQTRALLSASGAAPADARKAGLLAGVAWSLAPVSWLTGVRILSDPLGLCLALLTLSCAWRASQALDPTRALLRGAALGGLTLGVRLAYFPLLTPLLVVAWRRRRTPTHSAFGPGPATLVVLAATLAAGLALQFALDPNGWLAAAGERLFAHLGNWPRRHLCDGHWIERPLVLARTLVGHGIGGWWPGLPLHRLGLSALLGFLAVQGALRLWRTRDLRWWWLAWVLPDLGLLFLAQDGSLARYALPSAAALCGLAGFGAARVTRPRLTLAAVAILMAAHSLPLALEQQRRPSLGAQLAEHLHQHPEPAATLLVTDDVGEALPIIEESGAPQAIMAVPVQALEARARDRAERGHMVLATAPGASYPERWQPLAHFRVSPDVVSRGPWDVWLYRYRPDLVTNP